MERNIFKPTLYYQKWKGVLSSRHTPCAVATASTRNIFKHMNSYTKIQKEYASLKESDYIKTSWQGLLSESVRRFDKRKRLYLVFICLTDHFPNQVVNLHFSKRTTHTFIAFTNSWIRRRMQIVFIRKRKMKTIKRWENPTDTNFQRKQTEQIKFQWSSEWVGRNVRCVCTFYIYINILKLTKQWIIIEL